MASDKTIQQIAGRLSAENIPHDAPLADLLAGVETTVLPVYSRRVITENEARVRAELKRQNELLSQPPKNCRCLA